ncbi:translocation/assembly module TamB domain-containing protein [Idiomarina aminovorans]|uniref:translocation/assembly module TamB domain-containing protein n=1 Tax=Idiomarina aminovorans TaxID=2914829 RepID=UPI002003140C|nr:translocation/assembly module TamB domain-containing protein [Idiomarina sp. ATCH4]MCK7460415.1 translocation/assembly module TamB domain-containing protein [Idiomarina sp. ATCH4]
MSYPFLSNIKNNTHLHSPDFPSLKVKSQIAGDTRSLTVSSEFSEGLEGQINAKVEQLLNKLKWQFNSNWANNNLKPWLASMNAGDLDLNFSGAIKGNGTLEQAILAPEVSITANQQSADIDGNLHYQNSTVLFDSVNVRPKNVIQGQFSLTGSISALNTKPMINALINWDELTYQPNDIVSRNGNLKVQGAPDDLTINLSNALSGFLEQNLMLTTEAKLKPESLRLVDIQLSQNNEKVVGKANIDWSDGVSLSANLSGNYQKSPVEAKFELRMLSPYLFVDQFEANWGEQSVKAEGALSPGRKLNWEVRSQKLDALSDIRGQTLVQGSINGLFNQTEFELGVDKLMLKHPDYNAIHLDEPVIASFDYQRLTFDASPICLIYSGIDNPLCVQVEQNKNLLDFEAYASEVPLNLLQAFALPNAHYKINGSVSADIKGSFNYQSMKLAHLKGVINADNSQVQAAEDTITLNKLNLTAKNSNDEGIDVALTAKAEEFNFNLKGQLAIATVAVDSSISGKLSLNSKGLELISLFTPQLDIGDGDTSALIDIAGNLNDPTASGNINLSADRLVILASGTLITKLQAELTADANVGQFTINASGNVGRGNVLIKGKLNAFKRTGLLTIEGEELLILDTPDLLLVASPDVSLELDNDLVTITGNLKMPKAKITPVELDQAVTESADVTLKNEPKEEPLFSTKTDVTVSLGKDVRVEALGFAGNLQGKLQITQQPNSVTRGNGTIGVVTGDYEIYGQKLAIERGDLLFNGGPLNTPSLNLRVTRKIEKNGINQRTPKNIGARVTGTIDQPELTLFSTPLLPDSTILSYLLFGKPPGSQGDVNNLELQAALLVGGRSTKFLTEGIKDTFDLDEVSLDSETSDVNDTSLYIGKYLSPQLYIKYGIGLLEPTSTFILRYTLSDRLLFESTSTTEGQGGDLIYTIEN